MIFPPFPEPGFRKLSDLQSGIDSYYTADQLKKYGLKCVEEYKRCQSKQEWDIRGDLASSLKCWHRLTGAEAAELVEFTRDRLEGAQQVREPTDITDRERILVAELRYIASITNGQAKRVAEQAVSKAALGLEAGNKKAPKP